MEKKTRKVLIWEVVIVFAIFIILFILSLSKIISVAWLFLGLFISLITSSLIISIVLFIKKKKEKVEVKKEKEENITTNEAQKIADELLFKEDILEYSKNLLFESGELYFGSPEHKAPVYIRIFESLFENKIIGILVNKNTKESFVGLYDLTEKNIDKIQQDLLEKANLIVKEPAPKLKVKEVIEEGPVPGVVRKTITPIEEMKEEKKEEGLE